MYVQKKNGTESITWFSFIFSYFNFLLSCSIFYIFFSATSLAIILNLIEIGNNEVIQFSSFV